MTSQGITEADAGILPADRVQPEAVPVAPRPGAAAPTLLPSILTGGLLWLCYFPAACGYLAWVAFVPLLTLVRSPARPVRVYLSAFAGGLVFYWPALKWMPVADDRMYFTWAFLATYCSLYMPLTLWAVRFLDRRTRLPLVLTLPVVWTALELFRCQFGTGFSWYLLAHSQHAFLPLIQIADVTGAWGVSFLVMAVNALLFEALYARPWFRRAFVGRDAAARQGRVALLVQGVAVLVLLSGTIGYGFWRLGQDDFTPGPRLALIQGNLPQQIRNDSVAGRDAARTMEEHYVLLSDLAARYHPDLIVWPETSFPGTWKENADGQPLPHCQLLAHELTRRFHTSVLLGINAAVVVPEQHLRQYNSAVLIDAGGRARGRYDKIHRVPFGEYIPLRDVFPWMNRFAPYDFDYGVARGEHFTRFPLTAAGTKDAFTFGTLICYEDTDSDVSRPYGGGDGQAPADFLVNISNDGWFLGTSEHDEHLAICRFRAVECRRSVARAVNMGISAVIDGNGRVLRPQRTPLDPTRDKALLSRLTENLAGDAAVWTIPAGRAEELPVSQWGEYKKVSGVLVATIPIDHRTSLYARWGDWLPWSCGALLCGALLLALARPRAPRSPTGRG